MGDFTAFLVAAGPLAVLITKAVDFLRAFDKQDSWWKGSWIAAAMLLGIGYCLLTGVNLVALLEGVQPGIVKSLSGTAGQIATGAAIGAMASFWHEPLSGWGAKSTPPPMYELEAPELSSAPEPDLPDPMQASLPEGYDE